MELLVGTTDGVYVVGNGGARAAEGTAGKEIRRLVRANGNVLAAAADGILRADTRGRSWSPSGLEGADVWELGAGRQGTVLAGTAPAALYESRDGGETWSELQSVRQMPGYERWCVPSGGGARGLAIAFDAADANRIYFGVEVGGALLTTDGGRSWRITLPGGNPDIHAIVAHPARPNVLYATTGYGRMDNFEPMEKRVAGLYRSEDGGRSWRYLWHGIRPQYTRSMCIDHRAPYALTVACAPSARASFRDPGGAQAMLYQSLDGGDSWGSLGDPAHQPFGRQLQGRGPRPRDCQWRAGGHRHRRSMARLACRGLDPARQGPPPGPGHSADLADEGKPRLFLRARCGGAGSQPAPPLLRLRQGAAGRREAAWWTYYSLSHPGGRLGVRQAGHVVGG